MLCGCSIILTPTVSIASLHRPSFLRVTLLGFQVSSLFTTLPLPRCSTISKPACRFRFSFRFRSKRSESIHRCNMLAATQCCIDWVASFLNDFFGSEARGVSVCAEASLECHRDPQD
ncbi:hypothetical protein T440DRAFT_216427 [Plenodomus tracheiphilus IPT5]|uniref:Uncharacterized protein n=1 Tax=Plenodomus tracheiphilus IPT5 TaxID=1408161 RepID=A0A6A7AW94_9PLEO|nr:hypothetical protein T440DRAFT_216427 [Plenodomus tracheiphilus IPT5]